MPYGIGKAFRGNTQVVTGWKSHSSCIQGIFRPSSNQAAVVFDDHCFVLPCQLYKGIGSCSKEGLCLKKFYQETKTRFQHPKAVPSSPEQSCPTTEDCEHQNEMLPNQRQHSTIWLSVKIFLGMLSWLLLFSWCFNLPPPASHHPFPKLGIPPGACPREKTVFSAKYQP